MDFTIAFGEEDIDGVMNLFADSALWSPPEYNSYEWLSKDELKVALTNYMNSFDNLKFTPGINLPGGNLVDGFWGGSRYRSKKSPFGNLYVFPGGKIDEGDCLESLELYCDGYDDVKASNILLPG